MMKKNSLLLLFLLPLCATAQTETQNFTIASQIISGSAKMFPKTSIFTAVKFEKSECITPEQQFQINFETAENRKLILQNNPKAFESLPKITLFQNPFRPKSGFSDYGYHVLQNQVDQDLTPNGHLLDYNCGQRTYDLATYNHTGTDYILWPYPWKRMQENTMEVIAAASGVIILKKDGNPDKNCLNNGNPAWNGIVIEHSDGTTATYMHFKNNTVTSKAVGETVNTGELLGIAGSSGSSTIPHLHFEVRDENSNLIDPYMGPCNSTNPSSWWQSQESYYVPKINRISTHYTTTQDYTCPNIENTYERVNFNDGDLLALKLFYRDIKTGDVTNIKITNPDGTVGINFNWTQDWNAFYPSAYAVWTWNISNSWQTGVYNVDVTFGGSTYHTIFGVRTALSAADVEAESLTVYPNPVKDLLFIKNFPNPLSAEIIDVSGKSVLRTKDEIKNGTVNVSSLPKGLYILKLTNTRQEITTMKFIKH